MNWIPLQEESQIDKIVADSKDAPQVIFKHSTRCSTSSMVKNRLDKNEAPDGINFYYLDLIKYRNISNKIVKDFGIDHESPQALIIRNGKCVYNEDHSAITFDELEEVTLQR